MGKINKIKGNDLAAFAVDIITDICNNDIHQKTNQLAADKKNSAFYKALEYTIYIVAAMISALCIEEEPFGCCTKRDFIWR